MRLFADDEAAIEFAGAGGQALHVWTSSFGDYPSFFTYKAREMGRLYDLDAGRLIVTARFLGVKALFIIDRGLQGQGIELGGEPLAKAKEMCIRLVVPSTHQGADDEAIST